ncbi:hypothetical protein K1719_043309 [Acacia pycnantha]|nr:hypothetical protein K1719_043309 [Acacia pycnantha]
MAASFASKCSRAGHSLFGGLGNSLSGLVTSSQEIICSKFLSQQQQQRSFIQMRTVLKVVDNSGAKKVMCIQPLKGRKGARLGDTIIASVKEAHPNGKVKKGKVVAADWDEGFWTSPHELRMKKHVKILTLAKHIA